MGLFDSKKNKMSEVKIKSTQEVFTDMLKVASGASTSYQLPYDIFYRVIAFKGATGGVGTSTIVANTALALGELGLAVCVIDSSILAPSQDILLKTDWEDKAESKRYDWFDMMFTTTSVLNKSKRNSNVSVLSFKGKGRDITDALSTLDKESLVDVALEEIKGKFDIVLIDLTHEMTNINMGCIQKAQKVIQVWTDTPHCIANTTLSIKNNTIMACPPAKMQTIVVNKYTKEILNNFEDMVKQYKFKKIGSCGLSQDVAAVQAVGNSLWGYATESEDVVEFTDMIVSIVCNLLNVDLELEKQKEEEEAKEKEEEKERRKEDKERRKEDKKRRMEEDE